MTADTTAEDLATVQRTFTFKATAWRFFGILCWLLWASLTWSSFWKTSGQNHGWDPMRITSLIGFAVVGSLNPVLRLWSRAKRYDDAADSLDAALARHEFSRESPAELENAGIEARRILKSKLVWRR